MDITTHQHERATVLQFRGKFLGSLQRASYETLIGELKAQGRTRLVIDLGETDFMDSTAIGLLIASRRVMQRAGGDIRLANMEKRIRGLFVMTRLLGPVFTNYASVEAALGSYREHPVPKNPVPKTAASHETAAGLATATTR